MSGAFLMRRIQRVADLRGVFQNTIERQRARLFRREERVALEKFHDQVIRPDVVELKNVGVVESCHCPGFTVEALRKLLVGYFDGDDTVESRIAQAL